MGAEKLAGHGRNKSRNVPARILVVVAFVLSFSFVFAAATPSANAATPTLLNTSSTGGQTNWLESLYTLGETNNSANKIRISLAVKHDAGRRVTGLKIDDDWNGDDNTTSKSVKSVTAQQPTIQGGYDHSRVTYEYTLPTADTGMSCGAFGIGGTNKTTKPLRVRAVLDNGEETATSSSNIIFTRADCTGGEDFPYLYQWSQTATSVNPGGSVSFTFRGDDSDSNGNADFAGINWRLRRLSDGATTTPVQRCYSSPYDNTDKTLSVTFPNRGRWVVEAELLNNEGCGVNNNAGSWAWIGAVDVNAAAATSPTGTLSATRPQIGGNTTVSAAFADGADLAQGGRVQNLEWDLDGNTANGVNGFEIAELGSWNNGLTSPRARTVSTAGMTPGPKTVRARVTDNGALVGADSSRRQSVITTTYLVDTPPVATDGSARTVTGAAKTITLAGSDADGDSLTFSLDEAPSHGVVSGTGAQRVYTPEQGFAGTDSFGFAVEDGYGGVSHGTIEVRVDPDLSIVGGPTGTVASRGAEVTFGSQAPQATFECSFDGSAWTSCQSPRDFTDLPDGAHDLKVRATAGGLLNPDVESISWAVEASPEIAITDGPAPVTAETGATVEFAATESGATVAPTTSCRLDGGSWRPCESPYGYTDLDDGEHRIDVRATDAFGKQTVAEHVWTVAAEPPRTEFTEPLPPAVTNSTSIEIEFSATDPDSIFECRLDAGEWDSCVSPAIFNGLPAGGHELRVRAVNELGVPDPIPATFAWTIDSAAPVATILDAPPARTADRRPAFEFGANEPGSVFACAIDSTELAACASPFQPAGDLPEGVHTFRVEAIDLAGNRSSTIAREFTVDLTGPGVQIITGPVQGSEVADDQASFTFAPSEPGTEFSCRLDERAWEACASPRVLSGLGEGNHRFEVRGTDPVGNPSAVAVRDWVVDTIAPVARIEGGPSGLTRVARAAFSLSADEPGARFQCSLDEATFVPCPAQVAFGDLAEGDHELRVRATDRAGNQDPAGASRQWRVDTSPQAPPDVPVEPEPEPDPACEFGADLPACGAPSIDGAITGRKNLALAFEIDSGGAGLGAASLSFPAGAKATPTKSKAGRAVGTVSATGGPLGTMALKLPAKKSSRMVLASRGGATAVLTGRSLSITGLPAGTDSLRIRLRSGKGLRLTVRKCGTSNWKATLTDSAGNATTVSGGVDVACKKKTGKGGRR